MSGLYEKLVRQMTSHLGVDPGLINPDATFASLGVDSLTLVELAVIIEEECGIEVEGIDADGTLAEAIAYLEDTARAAGGLSSARDDAAGT